MMRARWVAFLLLGLALSPGMTRSAGTEPRDRGTRSTSAFDSLRVRPGGYVFPSPRDQWRSWAMNVTGPFAVAGNLAGASWRQWVSGEPARWDSDGRGFAQRFGAVSLTTAINETAVSALSALMRQDAAYYRSPSPGLAPRLGHALAMTFLGRDPRGDRVFSPAKTFSYFVGPAVTQAACYPEDHDAVDVLVGGACTLLINAALNTASEFVLRAPEWEGAARAAR